MLLYSTNRQSPNVSLQEAVFKGLPDDNGLYMPVSIPHLPHYFFEKIDQLTFSEIALEVSKALLSDEIPVKELKPLVEEAINFEAPVINIHGNINVLELFHGPTLAFKDFGARFMARVMSYFLRHSDKEINILVATSGDTGGAVARGFYETEGIKVTILYPKGKVSDLQEKQLTTLGQNITALEIEGTFDDCQRLVKQAFLDKDINTRINLSSANSINISRLIPQSFYYFYAYSQLKGHGKPVAFSVPSGNFGNLCGGILAKKMGLPVEKFIAATNINDVVPAYLMKGLFEPRSSVSTISNAMDVGNPSNFSRLLAFYEGDYAEIKKDIEGCFYTDEQTRKAIGDVYNTHGYMLDPHGAVGYLGIKDHLKNNSNKVGVFLATAHPSKFPDVIEAEIGTEVQIPERLAILRNERKVSIEMPNNFIKLKEYLIGRRY